MSAGPAPRHLRAVIPQDAPPDASSQPQPQPPPPERLCYRRAELPAVTGVPLRTLVRYIAAGEFPPADRMLGTVKLWSRTTIQRWLDGDCEGR
jgi:predicted DNA-binding transcriptional regulator AlpA